MDKIEKASKEIKNSIDEYEKNKTSATQPSSDLNGNESKLNDSDTIEEKNKNHDDNTGSLNVFILKFNQLESLLNVLFNEVYSKQVQCIDASRTITQYCNPSIKDNRYRPISTVLKELVKCERIDSRLNNDLKEIIKYRNALVHGQDLIPSKVMIKKIDTITKEVERLLES
ncbi:hypothetical protein H8R20_05555 [Morganella morganii]|uniref:hypothetical protein n=1 Tax=Morganella morganii TaxID=582 RepID=UPI0016442F48|nr:hypothetical protein [Morganella morganii]MBC3995062.1 hypothetical protein [Morganella morganii]